ncbi:antitoxin [Streptomyces sp. SYSU K217416]
MGLLDTMKHKVGDLAQQHGGKIEHGLDKAARTVDSKTKGKYSSRIATGTDKAKHALDRLAHKEGEEGAGPPPPPPGAF